VSGGGVSIRVFGQNLDRWGAGYVGSYTAKAVRDAGGLPIVFNDLSAGHAHSVRWWPLVEGNVCQTDAVRAVIREYRSDAVMQFSGRIEVGIGE
jgi:UDP-glucose 4-epimerase